MIDRLRWAGAGAGLVSLCLVLFLPGLRSIPPVDRDEPRYAQASRQMLESGDFLDIRFQDEPRHKKPAGIYWLQAASAALAGARPDDIAPYRVPSLLGAIAAVLLTAWAGSAMFGAPSGLLAAAMLASSLLLCVQARLATTDAVLLATVVAAEGAMARAYLRGPAAPRRDWLVLWIAIGIGLLVKGPIILIVCGGTLAALLAFDRSLAWMRHLRPLRGAALALAIAGPWLLAIGWRTGGEFFSASLGHEFLGKLVEGQELHAAPPGYHLLAFWLAFWPFSLLAAPAVPWAWARRDRPAVRFCAAWIVPTWLAFEVAATKLPHYTLPVYPAIALLAAAALGEGAAERFEGRWRRAALVLWGLATGVLALAVAGAPIALERRFEPIAIAAALAGSALCVLSLRLLAAGRGRAAVVSLVAAGAVFHVAAFGLVAPRLESLWVSRRVAALVADVRPCPESRVVAIGYHEPSLVFALGTDTMLAGAPLAARHLADDPRCALVLADASAEPALLRELEGRSVAARRLGEVRGLAYSTGRRVILSLWRAADAPQ